MTRTVDKINGSTNSICPETSNESSLIKHTSSPLNNDLVQDFGKSILLWYIRSCFLMNNTAVRKKGVESMRFILSIFICLKNLYEDVCIQFNHRFPFTKVSKGLSFSIKRINPDIVCAVICKGDVVLVAMT